MGKKVVFINWRKNNFQGSTFIEVIVSAVILLILFTTFIFSIEIAQHNAPTVTDLRLHFFSISGFLEYPNTSECDFFKKTETCKIKFAKNNVTLTCCIIQNCNDSTVLNYNELVNSSTQYLLFQE